MPLARATFTKGQVGFQRDPAICSESCFQSCISNVPVPPALPSSLQVNCTLVESHEPFKKHAIPSDYAAFQNVFSKQAAT